MYVPLTSLLHAWQINEYIIITIVVETVPITPPPSIGIAADGLPLYHRVLLLVLVHPPIVVSAFMMTKQLHKLLVMRDDDQLKVALHLAIGNDPRRER